MTKFQRENPYNSLLPYSEEIKEDADRILTKIKAKKICNQPVPQVSYLHVFTERAIMCTVCSHMAPRKGILTRCQHILLKI